MNELNEGRVTNDEERLEYLTSIFTINMLKYQFEDVRKYKELAQRLANLIDYEIKFVNDRELKRFQMTAWGANIN